MTIEIGTVVPRFNRMGRHTHNETITKITPRFYETDFGKYNNRGDIWGSSNSRGPVGHIGLYTQHECNEYCRPQS